jgi:hypothetical protein
MNELITTIQSLNTITPLGLIGGLGYIIYLLVKNQKGQDKIATNHLHGLPDMVEALNRIEEKLDRNFEKVSSDLSYIRGRINGKDS